MTALRATVVQAVIAPPQALQSEINGERVALFSRRHSGLTAEREVVRVGSGLLFIG